MVQLDKEIRDCIEKCRDCHQVCLETIASCLAKGGEHARAEHIILLQNCADICQVSVNLMATGSQFQEEACRVCAKICEQCATGCRSFSNDQEMERCARTCEECANACNRMNRVSSAA